MRTRDKDRAGAVLVFALLILVVGATILGGVAQLAVTQSLAGQTEWDSAARRIRLENSRSMARQYILSQMWRDYGQLPLVSLGTNASGGLGGFAITNVEPPYGFWLSLQPLPETNTKRINPFNLFERGGFQSAWAAGTLSTGSGDVPWGFQIRTRSPITAGFAFVNQRPASNSWAPIRRINMQQTTNFAVGFTNLPRMPVSSVTGTNTGDTNGFLGFLSAPKAEAPFGDFYGSKTGVSTNYFTAGSGAAVVTEAEVVINLSTFSYFNPDGCLFFEVPMRVDRPDIGSYTNPVTRLVLQGGPDGVPVQIAVPAANNTLTNIVLSGDNLRPVYVDYRGSNVVVVSTTDANTTFRIGMTLLSPGDLAPSGALTIVGGLRSSQAVSNSTGTVTLQPEANASWRYDAIADRMMWLEDQRVR